MHNRPPRARVAALALAVSLAPLCRAEAKITVLYVGGTTTIHSRSRLQIDMSDADFIRLTGRQSLAVPWREINTIEYGMRVNRRYLEAALISPLFLAAKKRTHFLTIGFEDAEGRQQALVLEVNKDSIRPMLVSLEARTGRRVEFQDEEARKAGRG